MSVTVTWKDISEAPASVKEKPLIVWIPAWDIAVSAMRQDGGSPWNMVDRWGCDYCLQYEEQPTHFLVGLEGPKP